jgi:hypothetical protein
MIEEANVYTSQELIDQIKRWLNFQKIKKEDFENNSEAFVKKLNVFMKKLATLTQNPKTKFDFNKASVIQYLKQNSNLLK